MNIYLTSCETGPNASRYHEGMLAALWTSSSRQHALVDCPEKADLIFIGNLCEENWYGSLRRHPVIGRYPNKCFIISEEDRPKPLLRGIYSSTSRKTFFRSRMRTGTFGLHHSDFQNPFVQGYADQAWEKPKEYLASFMGRVSHSVRVKIFNLRFHRSDWIVRDTSNFQVFTHDTNGKSPQQKIFFDALEKSKFAICPRGLGTGSVRLYEAMKMGVAPVIIADDWIPPKGPHWDEFAIFVREGDVAKMEEIISSQEYRYKSMGRLAALAYADHFGPRGYFDYLVAQATDIMSSQLIPESLYWRARNGVLAYWKARQRLQRAIHKKRKPEHAAPNVPINAGVGAK